MKNSLTFLLLLLALTINAQSGRQGSADNQWNANWIAVQVPAKAGLGDDYLNWLGIWKKNLDLGLTTWGETSEVESTRSDCHAWGASPNIEFFRIIPGIESNAPNFKSVKIEPHLGQIKNIGGEMPHPAGKISVKYNYSGPRLNAEIILPQKTTGIFIWGGKSYDLKEGRNEIKL